MLITIHSDYEDQRRAILWQARAAEWEQTLAADPYVEYTERDAAMDADPQFQQDWTTARLAMSDAEDTGDTQRYHQANAALQAAVDRAEARFNN
jgi:hypothetical protein